MFLNLNKDGGTTSPFKTRSNEGKGGSRENQAGEGLERNCLFVQLRRGFSILNLIRKPDTICDSLLGTLATPWSECQISHI